MFASNGSFTIYAITYNMNDLCHDTCIYRIREGSNAVEAAGNGAWQAGKTMAVMLVQVIAFMSGFEFLDATVAWFGSRVGIDISLRVSRLFPNVHAVNMRIVTDYS